MRIPSLSLWFSTVIILGAQAQTNETVQCTDPRIAYQGTWIDQDNGGHKFATTPGSSFAFRFQGTAVYWLATVDPRGAKGSVVVDDDEPVSVDTSSGAAPNDTSFPSAVMFAAADLDARRTHTLNVSYTGIGVLGGPYLEIYTLMFTQAEESGSGGSAVPPSPASERGKPVDAIIGGTVSGVAALLLVAGVLLYLQRARGGRKSAKHDIKPFTGDEEEYLHRSMAKGVSPQPGIGVPEPSCVFVPPSLSLAPPLSSPVPLPPTSIPPGQPSDLSSRLEAPPQYH